MALSLAAFRREAWLAALGLLVNGLRRALGWPAVAVAGALLVRGAVAALRTAPLSPLAPFEGALAVATAPRFAGLVGGLWLAGALAAFALRVAWMAGALPVLGAAMAGQRGGSSGFAAGVLLGLPRVLAAALLALVMELSGLFFAATLLLGAALVSGRAAGAGGATAVLLAAAVALALTLALAVPLTLSAAADALVVRAALRREGPAAALAGATRRLLARPGTFVLAALVFGLAALLVGAVVKTAGGLATGFAPDAPALVLLGPQLMLGALAVLGAGAVELLWLGTLAALAGGEAGPRSFRGLPGDPVGERNLGIPRTDHVCEPAQT